MDRARTYTLFVGDELVVSGDLAALLPEIKRRFDADPGEYLLILDDATGKQVDFELRGTLEQVLERHLPPPEPRGPGRPRLGVVAREVTLLPRHWEWLADQPGGASATLRRLVDEARKHETPKARARRAAATAGRAMTALAGDRPNFEEAYRALDAGDRDRFEALTAGWPEDVRGYLLRVAQEAFAA
ncbi:MAG TPA: DUF2239 family protein [Trueperaceae bacterium]|nr:DUF2239 family protein [Trueperaceae bacterium]